MKFEDEYIVLLRDLHTLLRTYIVHQRENTKRDSDQVWHNVSESLQFDEVSRKKKTFSQDRFLVRKETEKSFTILQSGASLPRYKQLKRLSMRAIFLPVSWSRCHACAHAWKL